MKRLGRLSKKLFDFLRKPLVLFPTIIIGLVFGWYAYLDYSRALDIPAYNLLSNGSFEESDDKGEPVGWDVVSSDGSHSVAVGSKEGYVDGKDLWVSVKDYKKGVVSITSPKVKTEANTKYFFKAYYITDTELDLLVRYHYKDGSTRQQVLKHYPDYDYPWSTMSGGVEVDNSIDSISFMINLADNGFIEMDGAYVVKTNIETLVPSCPVGDNLVPNPELSLLAADTPQGWEKYQYGNNQTTNQLLADGQNTYVRSEITDYKDGEAKWVYDRVPASQHTRYCLSFDYRTDVRPEIIVEYTLADGSTKYNYLGYLLPSNGWARYTAFTEAPANAVSVMATVNLVSKGYAETDNYNLVQLPGDGTTFNRPLVSVTFDDGWATSYTNGGAVLDKHGIKGTFYINPGWIKEDDFMSFDQLIDLRKNGHQLASHGNLHIDLTAFNSKKVGRDLLDAQNYLAKNGGQTLIDLASPYGKHDAKSDVLIKDLYASHRGTELGINTKQNFNVYNLKILFVRRETTLQEVQQYIDEAKANNGWLILVYHQIEDTDDTFIVSRETLDKHIQTIKQSGIEVKTVRNALNELQQQF